MSGATAMRVPKGVSEAPRRVLVTPEMAMELLEHNKLNRPLRQPHVERIRDQLLEGKWQYNGQPIIIAENEDVLDGQHRLWACVEAKMPIDTLIVYGVKAEAFSTIDTIRQSRTAGDAVAIRGQVQHRNLIATALSWLARYQAGTVESWKSNKNRIENSDIVETLAANPGIVRAIERCVPLRTLMNPGVLGFLYYIVSNRDPELADRMVSTLEEPSGVGVTDPFYRLRTYLTSLRNRVRNRDSVMIIALTIKALNAAVEGRKLHGLSWRNQGNAPEEFPKLNVPKK